MAANCPGKAPPARREYPKIRINERGQFHGRANDGRSLKRLQHPGEPPSAAETENVDGVLQATRSGAVTATRFCKDYIYR
jgi:hypothetical protein